jgi:hypothetical protein
LGLLLGRDFCSSAWGEAKLFIEVEDMIKSHTEDRQARTKAESELKDEGKIISQPSSKPHVGCCVLSTRR